LEGGVSAKVSPIIRIAVERRVTVSMAVLRVLVLPAVYAAFDRKA